MNEALPYVEATHAIYDGEATGVGHVPSWMIIDQRYRNRYLFAGLGPRQPFPGRWLKEGVVRKAATIAELAAAIEVPVATLTETVERFNGFATAGNRWASLLSDNITINLEIGCQPLVSGAIGETLVRLGRAPRLVELI